MSPSASNDLLFEVELTNFGGKATGSFEVGVALRSDMCNESEGSDIGDATFGSFDLSASGDAGDSDEFDFNPVDLGLEENTLANGNYCLRVEADPEGKIGDEVDLVDNVNELDFTVGVIS